MTKIKICGLFRPEDMGFVNEARPDYIGFVFANSRRRVNPETAAVLRRLLNPGIKVVGVFVDAPIEIPISLTRGGIIDLVQLHGNEDETYIRALKQKLSEISIRDALQETAGSSDLPEAVNCFPVIKAIRVERPEDITAMQGSAADYLLLDNGSGGTGKTFDWSLVLQAGTAGNENKKPFFLAGGLNPGNVEDAVKTLSPYAVDVSSGVETDGLKDQSKIIDIVARVRQSMRQM
ncbi:phosphoribosylanthranilate isomerase [Anoxybacterium hadale]|uniref:Phosphoribosylanthranilate isomerase n=1 Tax=Anoxybacterium hadale TaxID=3408580 RepID=A0ACD1A9P7_9FIRM|nr:phosphoribosylanthranilate isomerase [Clostridiales bacterium]